jgi:hypothetical protein
VVRQRTHRGLAAPGALVGKLRAGECTDRDKCGNRSATWRRVEAAGGKTRCTVFYRGEHYQHAATPSSDPRRPNLDGGAQKPQDQDATREPSPRRKKNCWQQENRAPPASDLNAHTRRTELGLNSETKDRIDEPHVAHARTRFCSVKNTAKTISTRRPGSQRYKS